MSNSKNIYSKIFFIFVLMMSVLLAGCAQITHVEHQTYKTSFYTWDVTSPDGKQTKSFNNYESALAYARTMQPYGDIMFHNDYIFDPPPSSSSSTPIPTPTMSVQQDIASTGNSSTQTPLPQSACNMMINGQCNPTTVTAVTAVAATAVIGGITAGVVSAVNNQAQKQQEQQKKQDVWNILLTQQKSSSSGNGACVPVLANCYCTC